MAPTYNKKDNVQESPDHMALRIMLRQLEKRITKSETVQFGTGELEKVHMMMGRMIQTSLFTDTQPPGFFEYWGFILEDMAVDCARNACHYIFGYSKSCEVHAGGDEHMAPWAYGDVADYHERLEERHYPHRDSPMWQGEDAYHVRGDGQPHMKFGMIYDVDGEDDKLLRGELLALLRLMIGRSNLKAFVDHMVIPVLLFSFMGPQHGRILQGHFDGKNLIVHYSKLYDFRTKIDENLNLFARWSLSCPIGDTKMKLKFK